MVTQKKYDMLKAMLIKQRKFASKTRKSNITEAKEENTRDLDSIISMTVGPEVLNTPQYKKLRPKLAKYMDSFFNTHGEVFLPEYAIQLFSVGGSEWDQQTYNLLLHDKNYEKFDQLKAKLYDLI